MLRAAAAVTVALLALGGCSDAADVSRDAEGRVTGPGTVRADRIRVGDCFDDPEDEAVSGFAVVPCGEPHDNEVFHLFDVPGDEYPGQDALTATATDRCEGDAFEDYVGRPLAAADELDVFQILPSPDTWERDDDRTVVCALFSTDRGKRRGSARGSLSSSGAPSGSGRPT